MAKKRKNTLITTSLSLAVLALSCCTPSSDTSSPTVQPDGKAELWSTYDTVKVVQNVDGIQYYDKLPGEVKISMMKNESESGQFIITPNREVRSYDVKKCSLKRVGGSEVISSDDITVYAQKYLEITQKYNLGNPSFVAGDMIPDMLLPIEKAVEYKENSIARNHNQGITIDVKTTHDTVPGTYRGEFEVTLDNEKYTVPVTVTVWNIDRNINSLQSCFLVYKNYLLQGEYDTSEEMIYSYYDMLLDYNVNTFTIRNDNISSGAINEYIRQMESRKEVETFNSIAIPTFFSNTYKCDGGTENDKANKEACYQYIKQLILNSTEQYSLIDKAYFYTSNFDEADMYKAQGLYDQALAFYKEGGELEKTLNYVKTRLEGEGVFNKLTSNGESAKYVNHVKDFITKIPSVWPTTTFEDSEVEGTIVTNCPVITQFNTGIYRQMLVDGRAKSNNNLWTYTCSNPQNPYPTFHIDDYNLGTRASGWMMKKYHINGYLYWAVNLYEPVSRFGSVDNYVDPYRTANRAGAVPGDGFLVYPGKYYNHYGPYPSNRLMSYRDASDDYDMLSIYEQLLQEKASKYGISIDVNEYVNDLYDSLFSGSIYVKDESLITKARKALAERIIALQNNDSLIHKSYSDGKNYNHITYSMSSSLTINNEVVNGVKSGVGYKYEYTTPVDGGDLVIQTEYTYRYALNKSGYFVTKDTTSKTSNDSSVSFDEAGNLNVTLTSIYRDGDKTIGGATQRFMPYASFKVKDLDKVQNIQFDVTNTSSETMDIYLVLSTDLTDNDADSFRLKPGETRKIDVNLNKYSSRLLSQVTEFSFKAKNIMTDESGNMLLCPQKTFTTTPIAYIERGTK